LNKLSQIPRFDQLLKRLYTDFHLPYRRGRSRQGVPVRVSQRTPLMNRLSPLIDRRPRGAGRRGRIESHSSSVSSCRCITSVDQKMNSSATWISTHRSEADKSASGNRLRSENHPFRDTP
jgi:hypothetical protein